MSGKPGNRLGLEDNSRSSFPFDDDIDLGKFDDDKSQHSVGQFFTKKWFFNNVNESLSLVEKTAKKLLPIYQDILRKIQTVERKKENEEEIEEKHDISGLDIDSSDIDSKIGLAINGENTDKKKKKGKKDPSS